MKQRKLYMHYIAMLILHTVTVADFTHWMDRQTKQIA